MITRELDRDVDFTWAASAAADRLDASVEPSRWQRNEPGESLLSAHRKPTSGR